ncbi:MAG: TonB-dependent receptor [Prolixibacteraceae bacterium]|nr:TonB-dependent receptor [Prolixibacteraceae bacterium]
MRIYGTVKDEENNEPLIGAYIYIKGTSNGVISSNSGYYSLINKTDSLQTLVCKYIGYKTKELSFGGIKDSLIDIFMEKGIELDEVRVSGQIPSESRFGINLTDIPISQIKKMPALIGEPDLMRSYQFLPEIQGGTEGKAGMYVRGGSSDQNLILLDGSPLYYVNHIGGFISIFDPEAIKNFKLYKGGFPARFGGRLSSVLDVSLNEGNQKETQHTISMGLLAGKYGQQGPFAGGKGSYFMSFRRMWLDLLMRPISYLTFNGYSIGYNFYDLNTKFSYRLDEKNKFFFSVYSGDDNLTQGYKNELFRPDVKSIQKLKWGNLLGASRWNRIWSPSLVSDLRVTYTRYRFSDSDEYRNKAENIHTSNRFLSRINDFGAYADIDYFLTNHFRVKTGTGITFHLFDPGKNHSVSTEKGISYTDSFYGNQSIEAWEGFLYLENQIDTKRARYNFGNRLSCFLTDGKAYHYIEPRFSVSIPVSHKTNVNISYSKMHQFMHTLNNPTSGFSTDFWVPVTASVPPEKSRQYALGFDTQIGMFTFLSEIYYKKLSYLVSFKEGEIFQGNAVDWQQRVEQNGTGTSRGLELLLNKKEGFITGWISYSLTKSDRNFQNINSGKTYPYEYDRRHQFNAVVNIPLSKSWDFSATWVYGSGYPITVALGKMTIITDNNLTPGSFSYDKSGEYYGPRNSFRMKDYHRLDIGVSHTKTTSGKEKILTIGVYNLYNRQNPFYYFYKERKPWRGDHTLAFYQSSFLPLIPAVSYTIKF